MATHHTKHSSYRYHFIMDTQSEYGTHIPLDVIGSSSRQPSTTIAGSSTYLPSLTWPSETIDLTTYDNGTRNRVKSTYPSPAPLPTRLSLSPPPMYIMPSVEHPSTPPQPIAPANPSFSGASSVDDTEFMENPWLPGRKFEFY